MIHNSGGAPLIRTPEMGHLNQLDTGGCPKHFFSRDVGNDESGEMVQVESGEMGDDESGGW